MSDHPRSPATGLPPALPPGDPSTPPRLAERLLGASVADGEWRDSIVGDLREEYEVTRRRHGTSAARRWYWAQALAIGTRRVATRWGRRRSDSGLGASAEIESRAGWFAGLSRDFSHAWRTLVRRPATSLVIVTTLGIALAANATTFAIMDAIVLRPFRFPGLERIVMVASSDTQQGFLDRESVSPADFRDWQRETRMLTHLSAAEWWDANLSGIDTPEQVAGFKVTAHFFDALGRRPLIGRPFMTSEETPGNHRRVVLGHGLWTRLFAGDAGILGRTVRIDGEPYEVVGVAPEGFAVPDGAQLWSPLAYSHEQWNNRRNRYLVVVGRLADGSTLHEARAEIGAIAERQRREYPDTNARVPNSVVTFTAGMSDPGAAPFISVMMTASLLLLLIACATIANLLLARGAERAPEFAMRLALGASRVRLAWQLLIEGGLLSVVAITLAVPLAWLGLVLSRASIPPSIIRFIPGWAYLDISPVVFGSAAAFGLVATLLFALIPAMHTVRANVADNLRAGARTMTAPRQRHWLRNSLAAAQVALTLALLFGTALVLSAADRAVNGAFGFDKRDLLVARLVLPERPYADADRRRQFIEGVLERIRAIPAVSSASMVSGLPYTGGNLSREFWLDGVTLQPGEIRRVDYRRATPEYFTTMKIPLISGRAFNDGDRAETTLVAIISRSVADRYLDDPNPVGRQFRLSQDGPLITVVGICGDVLHDWFQQRRAPTVYVPLSQDAPFAHAFVARTIGNPVSVAGDVRRAVKAVDPDQPIISLGSMETIVEERTSGLNFIANALGIVALIALLLAVMGLYSLMAYMVSRRTQELGVRLALGATKWQVIRLTSGQGVRITIAGLVLGGLAAIGIGRLMESVLYGAVAVSVPQLTVLVLIVAGVSVLASYMPARRTARLDPTVALRSE